MERERGLACDPVKLIIRIIGELNSPKERNPERDGEMKRATRGRQSVREGARQRHTSEQVATKRALFALRLIYHLDRFPPIRPAQRGLLLSLLLLFLCYRAARADYCLPYLLLCLPRLTSIVLRLQGAYYPVNALRRMGPLVSFCN